MSNIQLPRELDAEKAILGAILINDQKLDIVQESGLTASDFFHDPHRIIFEVVVELAAKNQKVDLYLLTSALRDRSLLEKVGGVGTLTGLFDQAAFSMSNVEHYGKLVRDKGLQRNIINACSEVMNEGLQGVDDIDEYVDSTESKIFEITKNKKSKSLKKLTEVVSGNMAKLQELYISGGKAVTGFETGFLRFDQITTGLHAGQVMVLGARPGMGKTAWFISALLHSGIVHNKVCALFSLEMSSDELGLRFCSALSRIDLRRLKTGQLSREEFKAIINVCDKINSSKIYIEDTAAMTILNIRSVCRRLLAQEGKLDIVVIDYLQLMKGTKSGSNINREQEISAISRGLKELAKELKVPVIALSQLNRSSQNRADNRPGLSDLRESGAIEQDADLVCFIHREEYYNKDTEDKGIAELIIAKNRHGESDTIKMAWMGQYTLFANMESDDSRDTYAK